MVHGSLRPLRWTPWNGRVRLIRNLVRRFLPRAKAAKRLLPHHLHHRYGPLGKRLRDLAINEGIVEASLSRVRRQAAVVNPGQARPIDRSQTHGARLTRRVKLTVAQLEAAQLRACLSDRD